MNNIIQTGLPLKMIHVSLINVTKWNTFEKLLFCFPYLIFCYKIVNLRLSFFEVSTQTSIFQMFFFSFLLKYTCITGKHCSRIFQNIFYFEILVFKKMPKQKCMR